MGATFLWKKLLSLREPAFFYSYHLAPTANQPAYEKESANSDSLSKCISSDEHW